MNRTIGIPLESFNLYEREFERSKNWASLFKRYETLEDGDELDFDTLHTAFLDENVEEDEDDKDVNQPIIELEDEEDDFSPFNQSVMQLRELSSTLLHSHPLHKNSGINDFQIMDPLAEEESEDANFDMQDILDRTIPIIAERERKWQESGMLNILNTFDEEKIERKVGSWLRINNSILSPNIPSQAQASDDEDDSLHSIDTARYVLSNRKPRISGSCCSSTTIKKFRRLQSKRDALREKYAFPEAELERALRCRVSSTKSAMHRPVKTDNCCSSSHSLQRVCESKLVNAKKRRKLLSKHRGRSCTIQCCSYSSSSSDEKSEGDDLFFTPVGQRQRGKLLKSVAHTHRVSTVKPIEDFSAHSFTSTEQRSFKIKRNQLAQIKPRKRESECCCHNKKKLCKRFEHLADTSTEEWVVENCDTPKKTEVQYRNVLRSERKISNTKKTKSTKAPKQKKKPSGSINTNNKTNNSSFLESSFERELRKAIEISKQTYEMENSTKTRNCTIEAEPKEKKIKQPKKSTKAEQKNLYKAVETKTDTGEKYAKSEKILNPFRIEQAEQPRKSLKQKHSQDEVQHVKKRTNKLNESSHAESVLVTTPKQVLTEQPRKSKGSSEKEQHNVDDPPKELLNGLCQKSKTHISMGSTEKVAKEQPRKSLNKSKDSLGKEQQIHEEPTKKFLNSLCEKSKPQVSMGITAEKALKEPSDKSFKLPQNSLEKKQLITEESPKHLINKTNKKLKRVVPEDFDDIESLKDVENISPARLGIKPQPKSAKLKKINQLLTQSQTLASLKNEETFFSMAHKICNSTALNGAAVTMTKQFSTDKPSASQQGIATIASDDPECFIVSSTTAEPSQNRKTIFANTVNKNDILLYSPHNLTLVPAHSCSDGVFQVTEEHLSSIIGGNAARKFMKYYIGRRRFDANLTVYYRPPSHNYGINDDDDDDTDSDVDELEKIDFYGDLYVLFDK